MIETRPRRVAPNGASAQVINGEPWFVAKDIAEALGYSNPRKAINDHCKEKGVTFRDSLT